MIAVSACLLGENCKYNGKNNKNQAVIQYLKDKKYITICPETLGGLKAPRPPSEIINQKVITNTGKDVTKEFLQGAQKTLKLCQQQNITLAILKSNSPSCGVNTIYDGTFSSKLKKGQGITAQLLQKNCIQLEDENTIANLITKSQ